MQVSEFENAPQMKRHPAYAGSMFANTAPEYSTGEVLLAAAYRGLLLGVSEGKIDLANIATLPANMPAIDGGAATWEPLLLKRGGLASPLRHGQYSPATSQQLMPLVPAMARIAGVLGKPRNRWNPFALLLEVVGAGAGQAAGTALLKRLAEALSVGQDDDIFARFVERSVTVGLQGVDPVPAATEPYRAMQLESDHLAALRSRGARRRLCPSERFCVDLDQVIQLKPSLTRRQWTALVEAILRLGLGMHVLWNCRANAIAWQMACEVASGLPVPTAAQVEDRMWLAEPESRPLLEIGADAEPLIERLIEEYAYGRTGINLLLCRLDDAGVPWPTTQRIGFDPATGVAAPESVHRFLAHVASNRQAIDSVDAGRWLKQRVGELFDRDLRELARRTAGYTRNLFFYTRYGLGQVKTKDPEQRSYDLSYLLAYVGERKPLPVQPGADMMVMLVHACCMANPALPIALDDFRQHLAEYGLHVPAGELIDGKSGRDLVRLGLVVDSPDAAGGRLLVPPF